MSEINRDFKGVWISKEIWLAKDLGWSEKLLLVEIDSLDGEQGCFASNEYLAKFFGLSKDRISKMVSSLKKKGYISVQVHYKSGTKQIEKRVIRVLKHSHTLLSKSSIGVGENADRVSAEITTGIGENDEDNKTINKTSYISTTTDSTTQIYEAVQQNIRFSLSPIEQQTIDYWIKDYSHELILEAIKRAALSNKTTVRYVEGILKEWNKKRITTLAEVERDDEQFKQQRTIYRGDRNASNQRSYEQSSNSEWDGLSL